METMVLSLAAHRRIRAKADGGAQDVCVGVIGKEFRQNLQRLVGIAALVCAGDDDLGIVSGDVGEEFVRTGEVEAVCGLNDAGFHEMAPLQ